MARLGYACVRAIEREAVSIHRVKKVRKISKSKKAISIMGAKRRKKEKKMAERAVTIKLKVCLES